MFNKYEIQARIFPALLNILPALILAHFYLYQKIPDLFDSVLATQIIGDFTIGLPLLYFTAYIARLVSKLLLQDKIFKEELHFPSTSFLLYSDKNYTAKHKEKIRSRIKNDFEIQLMNKKQEQNNELGARIIIKEAVGLIRNKVKNGRLLLQHNIEYGFIRNLLGGFIISIPLSFISVILFMIQNNIGLVALSTLLILIYLAVLVFSKRILLYYANSYANVLFNEYLSLK